MPIRYVNSHRGNFTFVRRDLVTVGRIPVVLARAYDSSLKAGGAFGPGWHLTLAESIAPQADGTLKYLDDSASEVILAASARGYAPRTPGPTDIAFVGADGDGIRVLLRSGWVKRFTRMNGRFALTEVLDPHGNRVALRYLQGRLTRVDGQNGRYVAIAWDASGRVARITDDQRREVNYAYDAAGRLQAVSDLGRYRWLHTYDGAGRLARITDPRNIVAAEAVYDANGRAARVLIMGAAYQYQYGGAETTIVDNAKRQTRIGHSKDGLVTSLTSPTGFVSEVELDSNNRVGTLLHRGSPRAMFAYGPDGRVDRLTRIETTGSVELNYEHDQTGRRTQVSSSDGSSQMIARNAAGDLVEARGGQEAARYEYSPQGDLRAVIRNGETTTYSYNADGQVDSVGGPSGVTRLSYDPVGKLRSIQFADGSVSEYRYSALGFREASKRGSRGEITYHYDVAGNLRLSHGHVPSDKLAPHDHLHAIEINAYNQAEVISFPGRGTFRVAYDLNGNPETVTPSDDPKASGTRYVYDAANRVVAVESGGRVAGSHVYAGDEPDLRIQLDDRTMRVGVDSVRQSASLGNLTTIAYARPFGSYFDAVRFDEATRVFSLPSDSGIEGFDAVVSNSLTRRRFADVDDPTSAKAQDRFDLPSNVIFLPPEYATINCAPGCAWSGFSVTANGQFPTATVVEGAGVALSAKANTPNGCTMLTCNWYVDGLWIGAGKNRNHVFGITGPHLTHAECECVSCDIIEAAYVTVNVNACGQGITLSSQTAATIPANRARTKVGVGEVVTLTLSSAPPCNVVWTKVGNGVISNVTNTSVTFTAPDVASTSNTQITAIMGSTQRSITFNVFPPESEFALVLQEMTWPPGIQGVGMQLQITVMPNDVSFRNVEVREIGGPGINVSGYWEQFSVSYLEHTPGLDWHTLDSQNRWTDAAGTQENPAPWYLGSVQWNIPVKWRVKGQTAERSLPNRTQIMTVHDSTGRSTVSKLGRSATRTP